MAKLTRLHGPMYLQLDDYPPYYDKQYNIFETSINKKSKCIHGYKNHVEQNVLITWVLKNIWKMFLSEFTQELETNPCPRKIICNTCELINVSGDIFNYGGNVEDE